MAPQSVATRVEGLEGRVTQLEKLPRRIDRIESQIVRLRTEMHDEFSAVRTEMREGFAAVRTEIRSGDEETRRELREEIRSGDEETRRYMRVLFEEYVGRLKLVGEAGGIKRAKSPKKGSGA